jgi:DDE family transposase
MLLGEVFDRFAAESPVSVMARAAFEHALPAEAVDELFAGHAERQYTRELLFSQLVDLMGLVVCRVQPSLNAASRKRAADLGVTRKAVYAKIARTEPGLGAALVRHTAARLAPVVAALGPAAAGSVPGFRVRVIDGSHLPGTEHRLRPLRRTRAGALPGQAVVLFDPATGLVLDAIPCEDAHAQERSLTPAILGWAEPGAVWVGGRNFCTTRLPAGTAERGGCFVVRQHGLTLTELGTGGRVACGRTATGAVSEEEVHIADGTGGALAIRRVTVALDTPTRDGDRAIRILTNLPASVPATRVAELYRGRWSVEAAFGELAAALHGEVSGLGYPRAALFAFAVALCSYNVPAVIKAGIRSAHGAAVEPGVSGYHVANEVAGASRGLLIAIPVAEWAVFARVSAAGMAKVLVALGRQVRVAEFVASPRGPKKPRPRQESAAGTGHVATARLLKGQKS